EEGDNEKAPDTDGPAPAQDRRHHEPRSRSTARFLNAVGCPAHGRTTPSGNVSRILGVDAGIWGPGMHRVQHPARCRSTIAGVAIAGGSFAVDHPHDASFGRHHLATRRSIRCRQTHLVRWVGECPQTRLVHATGPGRDELTAAESALPGPGAGEDPRPITSRETARS